MAPSASGYELDRAVWPPYRERVIGDTVIAASAFGRRPDGQYGTGTVVGFERYLGDPAGALARLDHDEEIDWSSLSELCLLCPTGGPPPTSLQSDRCGDPRARHDTNISAAGPGDDTLYLARSGKDPA